MNLPTTEGGRHQDWIWQFPIVEKTWTEDDPEAGTVTYQISKVADPVEVEAGVFVDLPTTEGGRHQDWIWQLPIMERTWTETDPEAGTVTYQISRIPDPVEVEAGLFENCIRLTSSSEKGQATHTYSPVAGLIKSHFLLDGLDGKRELWDIEKDYSWVSGGCHAATGQPEHEGQEPPASAAIPTPKRES